MVGVDHARAVECVDRKSGGVAGCGVDHRLRQPRGSRVVDDVEILGGRVVALPADHVAVEHRLDVLTGRGGEIGVVLASVESLFLAGDGEELDGVREAVAGHGFGRCGDHGGAAGVVVGARGGPRRRKVIEVTDRDVYLRRIDGSGECADDVVGVTACVVLILGCKPDGGEKLVNIGRGVLATLGGRIPGGPAVDSVSACQCRSATLVSMASTISCTNGSGTMLSVLSETSTELPLGQERVEIEAAEEPGGTPDIRRRNRSRRRPVASRLPGDLTTADREIGLGIRRGETGEAKRMPTVLSSTTSDQRSTRATAK